MKADLEHVLTNILDYDFVFSTAYPGDRIQSWHMLREQKCARQASRRKSCTYCFHLEDMVRRRAFTNMAVWAAAMGGAIALLTSSFGHLPLCMWKQLRFSG